MGNIRSGTNYSEFLLNKKSCGCFNKEAWGFKHCKSASGILVITSQWAVWLVVLFGAVASFLVHEHRELAEELRGSRLE